MTEMTEHTANDHHRDSALWEGDKGVLSAESRLALNRLIKGPYLTSDQKTEWNALIADTEAIKSTLNDLYLELVLDQEQGIAFSRNKTSDEVALPRVAKRVQLTFIDTALLLHLRKELNREASSSHVIVSKEQCREYLKTSVWNGKDEPTFNKRVNGAWKKFSDHNLLRSTKDEERFEISPALRLIFTADQISQINTEFQRMNTEGATK